MSRGVQEGVRTKFDSSLVVMDGPRCRNKPFDDNFDKNEELNLELIQSFENFYGGTPNPNVKEFSGKKFRKGVGLKNN